MKPTVKSPAPVKAPHPSILRGQAAAKAMATELRAQYKRWNLPMLSWKDGKVIHQTMSYFAACQFRMSL